MRFVLALLVRPVTSYAKDGGEAADGRAIGCRIVRFVFVITVTGCVDRGGHIVHREITDAVDSIYILIVVRVLGCPQPA